MDSKQVTATDPKKRKLTLKQIKFVDEYYKNGGNGMRAAMKAFDIKKETTAGAVAYEYLKKPHIQELIEKHKALVMDKYNITIESSIAPIGQALNAETLVIVGKDKKTGEKKTIAVADLDTRLKGSDRALKLLGVIDEKPQPNTINIVQMMGSERNEFSIT